MSGIRHYSYNYNILYIRYTIRNLASFDYSYKVHDRQNNHRNRKNCCNVNEFIIYENVAYFNLLIFYRTITDKILKREVSVVSEVVS